MVVADGVLQGPVPQTTLDMTTAIHSLERFLDLDIETVICYNGGLYNITEKKQLENLVK